MTDDQHPTPPENRPSGPQDPDGAPAPEGRPGQPRPDAPAQAPEHAGPYGTAYGQPSGQPPQQPYGYPYGPAAQQPLHYDPRGQPYGVPPQQPYGSPYGPPPGQLQQYDPYGQPYGVPPQVRPTPRRRQQDSEPGRFMWWDLGAFLVYAVGFLGGLVGFVLVLPPMNQMMASGDAVQQNQALFIVQAVAYGGIGLIAVVLSGAALWRSIRAFAYLWWLKLLLIPVAWIATIVINAIVVTAISDQPEVSQNQQDIEQMLSAVPFGVAVIVIALLGPYVEEYFFRHLMVGKLSRHINIWICGVISVITFPLLHFIPALIGLSDDLSVVTIIPYVTMGIIFTVAYILTGRSLIYAWLLHAFNNFMSLVMMYFVAPRLERFLEDSGIDPGGEPLGWIIDTAGAFLSAGTGVLC
ncbi:MAG TPA: CPBP family intramembrane metalloprotease [Candidatus Nesterenkonia stercoripullorum]|uniref:CPBP family intramembrane metalloprotease n=1 Tax=Candidatus Nesterenkonia stercoripullorum TaxID=2838701 RepID=A0A9D2A931_9MICC|nr:CPBP family intramembrane metalloprotease [Candidatus Nesterenkonia stercoripullorum]